MAAADPKANKGLGALAFNMLAVVCCTAAALLFVVALSLFLQGGYLAAQARETSAKTLTPANEPLRAANAEQDARLQESPRWLDPEQTKATLPIDAAMDRLAARQKEVRP